MIFFIKKNISLARSYEGGEGFKNQILITIRYIFKELENIKYDLLCS